LVWQAVVMLRAWAYRRGLLRQRRLGGMVISVGNLTVGGTGKTPLVLWLMERLVKEGKGAGVLTRGYRGFLRGGPDEKCGIVLSAGDSDERTVHGAKDDPDAGVSDKGRLPDEADLLMRRLRAAHAEAEDATSPAAWVGIGADRHSAGKQLEQQSVEWFVLDDGFQHLQLWRDTDIVVIDGENLFGNGQLLPAGSLREPVSALKRADVIVITRSDGAPAIEAVIRRHTAAPIFHARTKLEAIRRWVPLKETDDVALTTAEYSNQWFFAFCGIGNPRAFFSDVRRWGLAVRAEMAFRDHHRYSEADWARLDERARSADATALLCTEKDVCNFDGDFIRKYEHSGDMHGGRDAIGVNLPIYYARISLDLPHGDEFWRALMDAAEKNHAKADAGGRR
jgi:tetraacyldisaccharide 4'-kinase